MNEQIETPALSGVLETSQLLFCLSEWFSQDIRMHFLLLFTKKFVSSASLWTLISFYGDSV